MTDTLFAELLGALDFVVFERLPDGVFLRLGAATPPEWFVLAFVRAGHYDPITVGRAFPFLENFLGDAEVFWNENRSGRLRSDPFVVTDPSGGEVAIVASALSIDARRFLTLELPYEFEERRRALQRAREHELAHEAQLRRTSALAPPVAAAQKLLQQLRESRTLEDQERLAAGIADRLSQLRASIDALAPLPPGVTRRPRR